MILADRGATARGEENTCVLLCSRPFSPFAHRGGRVIGTDTLRVLLVLHVSSDGQKREQGSKDNPNVDAHQSTLPPPSASSSTPRQ